MPLPTLTPGDIITWLDQDIDWLLIAVVFVAIFWVRHFMKRIDREVKGIRKHENLEETKERAEALLTAYPDAVFALNAEEKIESVAGAFARDAFRSQQRQLKGLDIRDLLEKEASLDVRLDAYLDGLRDGHSRTWAPHGKMEVDGKTVWFELRGDVVREESTKIYGFVLTLRDVTDRRIMEMRLEKHAGELQAAYDKIAKLHDDVVSICRYTKQVNIDGKWIPVDEYLTKSLGLKLTHGISDEGLKTLERESGLNLTSQAKSSESSA